MPLSSALDEHHESADSGTGRVGEYDCQIITDFARLQDLAPAWDRLWRANPYAEIFQRFAWTQAWWQSFGRDRNLCTPVVFKRTEVVLILPLVQSRGKLGFLGWPQADYCDMLCSDPCPEELFSIALHALLQSGLEWRECVFGGLRPNSNILKASCHLPRELKKLLQLEVTDRCPTIALGERKNEVIDSRLANKHVRRRLQKLRKGGLVTFRHFDNKTEAQQQLTEFFRSHRRRCTLLAKASCFDEPEMQNMMRILVDQLDLSHELRFGALELNGRPIAWSLAFQVNGKYAYYQQTFDLDAEAYAPGDMLLHYLLLYAKQSVEREFDFLRGDEFFKTRVATDINPLRALYFQRPGLRGQLRRYQRFCEAQISGVAKQLESVVRKHETIFGLFRSFRTWMSTELGRLRRARGTGQRAQYLITNCSDLFWKLVWSKTQVTVFQKAINEERAARPTCRISDANLDIAAGRFSDLADLALQHPEIQFPGFAEYRNRLKRGDQVYLGRRNGKLILVAWARAVVELPKVRPLSRLSAAKAALEMYECWPIENVVPGCAELMCMLTTQALKTDANLLIWCPDFPEACEVELQRHGFVPRVRIERNRICLWLKYDRAVRSPISLEQQRLESVSCPRFGNL